MSTSTTWNSPGVTGVLDQLVVRHRRFHASLPGDRFLARWLTCDDTGLARKRGHDRLAAHLFADNLPMRRLLERLGYVTIDRPDGESMRAIVATGDTTSPSARGQAGAVSRAH